MPSSSVFYFSHLPIALLLLWLSTTAERFDERVDATEDVARGSVRAGHSVM